jgi:hypothetical protein
MILERLFHLSSAALAAAYAVTALVRNLSSETRHMI